MTTQRPFFRTVLLCAIIVTAGCATTPPPTVTPVTGFDADRYLGTWYEIARLDHRFERGMTDVTATYSRNENGSIKVLNRGFDVRKERWESAEGRALFRGEETVGSLKVSFFGPFFGGYHIAELDEDYTYALIAGPSYDYLWILARWPELDDATVQRLIDKAEDLGFPIDELVFVTHERSGS